MGRADDQSLHLYQCKAIVTGTDAERRAPTMIECYRRTLVKVSGDQRLLDDRFVNVTIEQVLPSVEKLTLHDRLWRRPIHDEQGTRDRPHDLTVDFKQADIDARLAEAGRKPWTGHRALTEVVVLVRQGDNPFVLSLDGDRGPGMSDSLAAASERVGLPSVLPSQDELKKAALEPAAAVRPSPKQLQSLEQAAGAEAVLTGIMTWSDDALGWIVNWSFTQDGDTTRWHVEGVNFDDAFRIGLGGAAQILSGNVQP